MTAIERIGGSRSISFLEELVRIKSSNADILKKLNVIYAKDYAVKVDFKILFSNLKKLGN